MSDIVDNVETHEVTPEAKPVRKRRAAAAAAAKEITPEITSPADAIKDVVKDLTIIDPTPHEWVGHALVVTQGFVCTCHTRTNRYPLTYSPGDVIPRGHDQLSHVLTHHLQCVTKL
jgi:hypothetical protein